VLAPQCPPGHAATVAPGAIAFSGDCPAIIASEFRREVLTATFLAPDTSGPGGNLDCPPTGSHSPLADNVAECPATTGDGARSQPSFRMLARSGDGNSPGKGNIRSRRGADRLRRVVRPAPKTARRKPAGASALRAGNQAGDRFLEALAVAIARKDEGATVHFFVVTCGRFRAQNIVAVLDVVVSRSCGTCWVF
jgi:hypothetical protein